MEKNVQTTCAYMRRLRQRTNEIVGTVLLTFAAFGFLIAALLGGGTSATPGSVASASGSKPSIPNH